MTKRLVPFALLLGLSLAPPASASREVLVRVTDAGGRPVAGATVRAAWKNPDPAGTDPLVREASSPQGTVRLPGLPADRTVWVYVEKAGFTPESRSIQEESQRELRITLKKGGPAFGRVVDEKGRPVDGAQVELSGLPAGLPGWDFPSGFRGLLKHTARSSPAGRFRFHDLPRGRFQLILRHPDYAVRMAHSIEGGPAGRLGTFVLRRGVTLRGTVVDGAGEPVAGARVRVPVEPDPAPAPSAVTGADGTFAVPGIPPDAMAFAVVCADGFLQGEEYIPFPEEPVRISLDKAAALRGRVLGPGGTPLPGALVRALPSNRMESVTVVRFAYDCLPEESTAADAEGRFAFGRLEPGPFEVVATAPGLHPGSSGPLVLEAGAPVEDLDLLLREGATVTGRVLDPDGAPIPGARVEIWLGRSVIGTTSGPDGSFRLEGADRGLLNLHAWAEHFRNGMVQAHQEDDEPIDIVLEPEGDPMEIAGRVLGPDGQPVAGALISYSPREAASARDGSFSLRLGVRFPGTPLTVSLTARKEGLAPLRKDLVLTEARTGDVVLHLEAGSRVSGRLLGLTPTERKGVELSLLLSEKRGPIMVEGIAISVDASGRFQLGPVPAGTWLLAARTGDRRARRQIVLDPGQAEASVDLTFPPLQEVSGRVLAADGRPAAHASIAASDGTGTVGSAWTRADGTFFLQVPAGDLTLSVYHGHLDHRQPLQVGAAPVTGVEVRLGAEEPEPSPPNPLSHTHSHPPGRGGTVRVDPGARPSSRSSIIPDTPLHSAGHAAPKHLP